MYTVESSLSTDEPIMLINEHVGFDPEDGMGIDGALFQRELLELDNKGYNKIKVYINSPGGVVMDGYNIYNAILKTKTPVDTYNVGIAASIAGVIFMAGRKRIMADYSQLMMHNPFGGADKKQLDAMRQSLCTMLASRSGISTDNVAYMMDRTTWMNPSECLEKGFCTDIEVTNDHNRKYMPATSAKAMWSASNKILNNIFKTDHMADTTTQGKALGISLIANYLGLNTDATENSVLTEVQARINSSMLAKTKSDEELDKMKRKLDKMKEDMDSLQEKYDQACKDAKDAADKAAKDKADVEEKAKNAELLANKATAKVAVEAYAKIGKIKNEEKVIEKWINLWVADADGTKQILEDIPLNKQAVTIQVGVQNKTTGGDNTVVDPFTTPASAMHYMARVQAGVNNRSKAV